MSNATGHGSSLAAEPHITPAALGAYLEGAGTPDERAAAERHLAGCDDCYELFVASARLLQDLGADERGEGRPGPSSRGPAADPARSRFRPSTRRVVLGVLATAASLMLVVSIVRRDAEAPQDVALEYRNLIAAVQGGRPAEGRLAEWATYGPPPAITRAGEGPALQLSPTIEGAIARVQQAAARARTPEALRALGVSSLVAGDVEGAIAWLQQAADAAPEHAAIHSDLAAAYLERARRAVDPVPDAERGRVAASRALELEPQLREARFNLALAVEYLQRRDAARAAWRAYLELDAATQWAAEARRRLDSTDWR